MSEPTTRPSDYAELLEDDKAFKRYMIDYVGESKEWRRLTSARLSDLEKQQPTVTMTVNEVQEFKHNYHFVRKMLAGLIFIGGTAYAVWEGWLHLVAWIKQS